MSMQHWWARAKPLPGRTTGGRVVVAAAEWLQAASDAAAAGGELLSLWVTPPDVGSGAVHAALLVDSAVLLLEQEIRDGSERYQGLQELFPAAARMQRAAADLCGVRADAPDQRPWLRHTAWTSDEAPLARAPTSGPESGSAVDDYSFVRVAGDGVHEIPVGPVHAGIIEPGHFRFSVVGEKVLRLEERLGYVHKGVERRFTELDPLEGHRLAARICGDSTVAYSWAYCQALEALAGLQVPVRATWLRGICLEVERLQNHLGDLGALGNDAGFAFGLAQFSRLKEELLRVTESVFGQRYLMDVVVPGGVAIDPSADVIARLSSVLRDIAARVRLLRDIYDDHSGIRDRFAGAGVVTPELARQLGLTGLAGRASLQLRDLRADAPWSPYHALTPTPCIRREGDVAARVAVRFDEVAESSRLTRAFLSDLPDGPVTAPLALPREPRLAIGLIEGWRGPVLVALEITAAGRIRRCHVHDPSWQNWPALEHAIISNIVPDFPLINKSFNLSYSGHDL